MSLDPVSNGLSRGLPATGNVQSVVNDPVKHVDEMTKPPLDSGIPGGFPSDDDNSRGTDAPAGEVSIGSLWTGITNLVASLAPKTFDGFENGIKWLVNWLLPPPKQAQAYEAALNRPISSTFLVCQMICCGVPLLVFLAGAFLFAAVALLLWAVLSLLILGPILLVASMMGISLWGWGWVLYGLVKWIDQTFLGGMITRFWLSGTQGQAQGQTEDSTEKEEKKES